MKRKNESMGQPAYKNPNADLKQQQRDASADVGGRRGMGKALAVKASMKHNGYNDPDFDVPIELEAMNFDFTDTADPKGRRGAPVPPTKPRRELPATRQQTQGPTRKLPGVATEATPFGGPERRTAGPTTGPSSTSQAPASGDRRRKRSDTSQFQMRPDTPLQKPSMSTPQIKTDPGESSWDVYVDGAGVYKVPAPDEQSAKDRASEWLNSNGDPDLAGKKFDPTAFQAVRSESEKPQLGTEGLKYFRHLVNTRLQEIVRKKEGGGGYNLYSPNKGKKKNPKPVGEFPTRMAAKRAELARFPPKDPEQLKRARMRLDKLAKDPKKQQAAARKEMGVKGAKRSGKSAGARKTRKEAIIQRMTQDLKERLFREEEVMGSPWDERISSLHPDAVTSDKRLQRFIKGIESASAGALGDSHKTLAKVLRGIARINPGDVTRDEERGKMFMPINLDIDGQEIGPVHLYVDGGNVCIEISQEAREMIGGLDPSVAKNLRGGLMSFQEDHLPKMDKARKAWTDRDTYLDKLHQRLEKQVGGLSAVELHLAKQMMNKRRR